MIQPRPDPNAALQGSRPPSGAPPHRDPRPGGGHRRGVRARGGVLLRGALALAVAWMGPASWLSVGAQGDGGTDLLEARVRLARAYEPIEVIASRLDPTTFDVDALAFELAFEVGEDIVAEVHRRVRFEPYVGVLRGARGTLATGAGNALDQAVLTALLLGDAGYDTEIRTARLDAAAAELLWARIGTGGRPTSIGSGPVEAAGLRPELVAEAGAFDEAEDLVERRGDEIQRDVAVVERLLAEAVELGDGLGAAIGEAVAGYAWVAYRLGNDAPWAHAHPVFGGDPPALVMGLEPDAVYVGSVPEDVQHRIRIQAFVERSVGGQLSETPVMDAWERPVANAFGVPLTYTNAADGAGRVDEGSDPEAVRAATSLFFPMFQGELPDGALAFTTDGATVPPEEAASPYAAFFATTARALGDALGALGGLGDSEADEASAAMALTGFGFDFTLIEPGGDETTHRRMVVDRIGTDARAAGEVRLDPDLSEADVFAALTATHTIVVDPGRYTDEYVVARGVEHLLELRPYLDAVLEALVGDGDVPAYPGELRQLEEPIGPLLLASALTSAPLGPDVLSYRPAPGLVVITAVPEADRSEVDVVANPRWSLRLGADGPRPDAAASRFAGIWETRTEALGFGADEGHVVIPAFATLAEVEGARVVVTAADAVRVAALPYPAATRAAMLEDLERGYAVVAAETPTAGTPGWWRVDPTTGATLGRGGDGRGASFVEYLTSWQVSVVMAAGFTGYGVGGCMNISDGFKRGCCIAQNVAVGAGGLALGLVMASLITGSAAALMLLKADVTKNLALSQMPSVCGN